MIDLKPAMLNALASLPACTADVFAREEVALPVVTVGDESARVLEQAGGQAYLEEYVAAVDLYAGDRGTMESLLLQTDEALTVLGMRRVYQQDLYDEAAYAFRKRLRYRAVLRGETIYQ